MDETVKELASIDGAFIIQGSGVLDSAGTHTFRTTNMIYQRFWLSQQRQLFLQYLIVLPSRFPPLLTGGSFPWW